MGKDLKGKEIGKGISQRKNGKYCARYVNRFGVRESVYGNTLKEVKNKLSIAVSNDIKKLNIVNDKITLDEWYDKWMKIYKTPVVRLNTKRYYEYIYETKISPVLGKLKLSEITKLQITSLINNISSEGYQWETLNKVRILLIDMFDRAMEDDFVSKNPAKGIRLPRNRPQNQAKALSIQDQSDFFECSAGTFYHNLFVTAINTGLRPGELFALTRDDLDFERKEIRVNKTLLYQKLDGDEKKEFHIGEPKTKSSNRIVPMNKICENALIKQLILRQIISNKRITDTSKKQRIKDFSNNIFVTKYGTPLNSEIYNEAIERVVAEINLLRDELDKMPVFSGHCFRHTFATRCFEAGIPAKTVQAYLGHSSIKMTMDLYTHLMDCKKQEDMELLEKSIGIDAPKVDKYPVSKIIKMYG